MAAAPNVKRRLPRQAKAKGKVKKTVVSGRFVTKLEKRRSQIHILEAQRLVDNEKIGRMKSAAALVESQAAENKSVLEQYRSTWVSLDLERKAVEQEYSKQRATSLTALKNRTSDIDKVKEQFDAYRQARAKDYQAAEAKGNKATQEYEAAKRVYDAAENAYQTVKKYQEETEKSFVELRSFKSQIEKERNHKTKYFLNEELKVLLNRIQLKPYRTLAAELAKAFDSLDSARETLVQKQAALEQARAEAEVLRSELETLDRTRRERILAKL